MSPLCDARVVTTEAWFAEHLGHAITAEAVPSAPYLLIRFRCAACKSSHSMIPGDTENMLRMREAHRAEIKQLERDAREDAQTAAVEAMWKERESHE